MTQQYDPRVHEDDWTESVIYPGPGSPQHQMDEALAVLTEYGQVDGAHHLRWVIDQAVRALTGTGYDRTIAEYCAGEDGPETYHWDTGTPP